MKITVEGSPKEIVDFIYHLQCGGRIITLSGDGVKTEHVIDVSGKNEQGRDKP